MRTSPRRLALLAALLSAGTAYGQAPDCVCGTDTCGEVRVTEDNFTDFNCDESLVGQTLPDSDGDGLPDACDACPCDENPIDDNTGRAGECPADPTPPITHPPESDPTGPDAPEPGPVTEPPPPPGPDDRPALPRIRCVDGRVVGIPGHATLWFLRPRTFAFTRFEKDTTAVAAGGHLLVLRNLDTTECESTRVGGVESVRRTDPPEWYLRGGLFAALSSSVTEVELDASLGLDGGVDYHPADGWWALGPAAHLATLIGQTDGTPALIGGGARFGVLDVFALTPFVQFDMRADWERSYGIWVTFDWGVVEDLGVELEGSL